MFLLFVLCTVVRVNVDSIQSTKTTQKSALHAALKKKLVVAIPVIGISDDDDEAAKKRAAL